MQPTLTLTDAPEPHMRQAIAAPLIQFNNSRASQPGRFLFTNKEE